MKTKFPHTQGVIGLLFFLFAFTSNAQYNAVEFRFNSGGTAHLTLPMQGINGKISKLSYDLIGYKSLSKSTSARLRIGYRRISLDVNYDFQDGDYSSIATLTGSNTSLIVAPGITRYFNFDKLTFLTTAEIPFTTIGKFKADYFAYEEDNTGPLSEERYKFTADGGFSVGLNGIAGVRYTIAKRFLVGLDLNMGFQYLRMDGWAKDNSNLNGSITENGYRYLGNGIGVTPLSGSLVVGMKF